MPFLHLEHRRLLSHPTSQLILIDFLDDFLERRNMHLPDLAKQIYTDFHRLSQLDSHLDLNFLRNDLGSCVCDKHCLILPYFLLEKY